MKTIKGSALKGAVLAGAVALFFSLNLNAGVIDGGMHSLTAVSDTGKMHKKDAKMKKKMAKTSKMKPSKMEEDKMGSKM